jgi:radical SAM superfamily enzyme YgiQ (UPF0313 family)
MTLLIYLADLYHDYLPTRQHVPLGVGYIGEYLNQYFPNKVEVKLFKSTDKFLDSIEARQPDIIGLSNYTWNNALNQFVGKQIRSNTKGNIPIVMGGPNIRLDDEGIFAFLEDHSYVDRYVMYSGERPMADIIEKVLELSPENITCDEICAFELKSSYSITNGKLSGGSHIDDDKDLDYIPSPYLSGALDEFLNNDFLPILETNRGCPFSCTFCVWGISALNKLKQFGMERVKSELEYVVKFGPIYSEIVYADANFGILKRDLEISKYTRELYDSEKSFQAVQFYWSKTPQPHMIDIGKVLGHLTHTYVAFQSLDPVVLEAIKRKNISTEKLAQLIDGLRQYTHSTQTDLLVGLPNEDFDSHLRSLESALTYGIDLILGGEIRLLPGSELDSVNDREKFKLKTKYRLCEGQYGYYQGELIFEYEEVVRQTSTMTETEMLKLRVLRTIFFASVTIGEHRPLIIYLVKNGYSIMDIFKQVAETNAKYPAFDRALAWCEDQSNLEWFDSIEFANEYFKKPKNIDKLFNSEPFMKLNFGMFSRLMLNSEEYAEFNNKMEDVVLRMVPEKKQKTIQEIFQLCRARNLIRLSLTDEVEERKTIVLSEETWSALEKSKYIPVKPNNAPACERTLSCDPNVEKLIADKISEFGENISVLQISRILESYPGRTYLEVSADHL